MLKHKTENDLVSISFLIPKVVRDKVLEVGKSVDLSFGDFSRIIYEAGLSDVIFKKEKKHE